MITRTDSTLNQTFETITKSLLYPDLEGESITHISHHNDIMYISATNGVYKLNLTTQNYQKVLNITDVTGLSYNGTNAYVLSGTNTLFVLPQTGEIETEYFSLSFSGIASSETCAYLSSKATHQVFEYNGASLKDMQINKTISPNLFDSEDFLYLHKYSHLCYRKADGGLQ